MDWLSKEERKALQRQRLAARDKFLKAASEAGLPSARGARVWFNRTWDSSTDTNWLVEEWREEVAERAQRAQR